MTQFLRKLAHGGTVRVKNQYVIVLDHGPDFAKRQDNHVLPGLYGRDGSSNRVVVASFLFPLLTTGQVECEEQITRKNRGSLEQFRGTQCHGFHGSIVRDARHFKGRTRPSSFNNGTCGDSARFGVVVVWVLRIVTVVAALVSTQEDITTCAGTTQRGTRWG